MAMSMMAATTLVATPVQLFQKHNRSLYHKLDPSMGANSPLKVLSVDLRARGYICERTHQFVIQNDQASTRGVEVLLNRVEKELEVNPGKLDGIFEIMKEKDSLQDLIEQMQTEATQMKRDELHSTTHVTGHSKKIHCDNILTKQPTNPNCKVDEVITKAQILQKDFEALACMIEKSDASTFKLDDIRLNLVWNFETTMPIKESIMDTSDSVTTLIDGVNTASNLIQCLKTHDLIDYVNYHLLYVFQKFIGDKQLKKKMEDYEEKYKHFLMFTTLETVAQAFVQNSKIAPKRIIGFPRLVLHLDEIWEGRSMGQWDQIMREFFKWPWVNHIHITHLKKCSDSSYSYDVEYIIEPFFYEVAKVEFNSHKAVLIKEIGVHWKFSRQSLADTDLCWEFSSPQTPADTSTIPLCDALAQQQLPQLCLSQEQNMENQQLSQKVPGILNSRPKFDAATLVQQLETKKEQIIQLKEKISGLQSEISTLKQTIADLQQKLEGSEELIERSQKEYQASQVKLARMEKEFAQISNELAVKNREKDEIHQQLLQLQERESKQDSLVKEELRSLATEMWQVQPKEENEKNTLLAAEIKEQITNLGRMIQQSEATLAQKIDEVHKKLEQQKEVYKSVVPNPQSASRSRLEEHAIRKIVQLYEGIMIQQELALAQHDRKIDDLRREEFLHQLTDKPVTPNPPLLPTTENSPTKAGKTTSAPSDFLMQALQSPEGKLEEPTSQVPTLPKLTVAARQRRRKSSLTSESPQQSQTNSKKGNDTRPMARK